MIRLIPPIAVPIGSGSILASAIAAGIRPKGDLAIGLARHFGASRAWLYGSGRAALASLFATVGRLGRDVVLMPAYTCWSVPAAAVRAGCRVRLYDLDPATFMPAEDLASRVDGEVAAVLLADLLSPVPGLARLAETLSERFPSLIVIEDRAQSWPVQIPPRGVTLLSFGRGKPLPLGHGGALVTNRSDLVVGAEPARSGGFGSAIALAGTSLFGRSAVFRIPATMPGTSLGTTEYNPGFDVSRPFRDWQAALGLRMLPRMQALIQRRAQHAAQLTKAVSTVDRWQAGPWTEGPIRLPVLAQNRAARDRMISALRTRGVSASAFYPGTLGSIDALKPHLADPPRNLPGAEEIASRLMTLPVYPTLRPSELEQIAHAFVQAAQEAER